MKTDEIRKELARNLRQVRTSKHMTQSDVADGAKIHANHYAKIERGETLPSLVTLKRIVKSIGVKSSDVLPF